LYLIGAQTIVFHYLFFIFYSLTWIDQFQFKFQHPNWI
jgi:hypothetical protein